MFSKSKHPAYKQGEHAWANGKDLTSNLYKDDDNRKALWDEGWINAEENRHRFLNDIPVNSLSPAIEKAVGIFSLFVIMGIVLIILYYGGIAAFGGFIKASTDIENATTKAKSNLQKELFYCLGDAGLFEVKFDHSIYAFVDKNTFLNVPYPERAGVLTSISRPWCEAQEVNKFFLPKVVLKDIRTGETIASERCILL
jgi:hypothetical protein